MKTRTATVSLPLQDATQDVRINYQLRGYVATEKGTRVALVVHVGDTTQVIDVTKAATAKPAALSERLESTRKEAAKSAATKRPQPVDDDFFFQFSTLVPAGNTHKVTMFLLAERDGTDAARAYLQVDTLDCEIQPAKK
ncbi:MAG: hypothetical protein SH850_17825 [Planctomycetaceae bacterium]|nr:hypothetical protein [Planctomycetaceae bacterium]